MRRIGLRTRFIFLSLIPAAVLPSACDEASPGDAPVETTDSAGVSIVTSLAPDLPLLLTSDILLSLGGKDTDEESFYRVGSSIVGTDGRGNIHVLDRPAYRIQVFDSAGRHLRTLGREGDGPGELRRPWVLTVASDGRVAVVDMGKRSLMQWGPDGELLEGPRMPDGYFGGEVRWTPSGTVFPLQDRQGQRLALVPASGDARVLAALPATDLEAIELESCGMAFSGMAPVFSPSLVWTTSGSTVVVTAGPEYVVDVFVEGERVRSLRRTVSPRTATAEMAEASLGDGMRVGTPAGERVCDVAEVVEQRGFAPLLPALEALALAPDGTLWAQRYTVDDEPGAVDLFDPEGRYLGTLPPGSPFPIAFLPGSRMLVAERDELDVERLEVRTAKVERP